MAESIVSRLVTVMTTKDRLLEAAAQLRTNAAAGQARWPEMEVFFNRLQDLAELAAPLDGMSVNTLAATHLMAPPADPAGLIVTLRTTGAPVASWLAQNIAPNMSLSDTTGRTDYPAYPAEQLADLLPLLDAFVEAGT